MAPLRDAAAIVGIGQTAVRQAPGAAPRPSWRARPSSRRWPTPGSSPREVDGLCSYTMETTDEVDIARNIGAGDITFFSQVGYGGGAGCGAVGHAAMAVATGQAEVAVAWRSRKRGARTTGPGRPPRPAWPSRASGRRPLRPAAAGRRDRHADPPLHARVRRRPGEHLANVAVAVRRHANRNPAALMHDQAHDPGRLHGRPVGVGAAVPLRQLPRDRRRPGRVLVSAERARDCRHPPATSTPSPRASPPAPDDGQLLLRRPAHRAGVGVRRQAVGERRLRARRRRRGPDLRRLHPARSCCRSRATGSASGARPGTSSEGGTSRVGRGRCR